MTYLLKMYAPEEMTEPFYASSHESLSLAIHSAETHAGHALKWTRNKFFKTEFAYTDYRNYFNYTIDFVDGEEYDVDAYLDAFQFSAEVVDSKSGENSYFSTPSSVQTIDSAEDYIRERAEESLHFTRVSGSDRYLSEAFSSDGSRLYKIYVHKNPFTGWAL